jgi:hypothetical protein
MTAAFWIEDEAGATGSEANRRASFAEAHAAGFAAVGDDGERTRRAEFAVTAWRLAAEDETAPSRIRWHSRIRAAGLHCSLWDGTLLGSVTMATPWPVQLERSHEWRAGRPWRDWPREYLPSGDQRITDPSIKELSRKPFAMAGVELVTPVPVTALPPVPLPPTHELEQFLFTTITVLVEEMNRIFTPPLRTLEGQ